MVTKLISILTGYQLGIKQEKKKSQFGVLSSTLFASAQISPSMNDLTARQLVQY